MPDHMHTHARTHAHLRTHAHAHKYTYIHTRHASAPRNIHAGSITWTFLLDRSASKKVSFLMRDEGLLVTRVTVKKVFFADGNDYGGDYGDGGGGDFAADAGL